MLQTHVLVITYLALMMYAMRIAQNKNRSTMLAMFYSIALTPIGGIVMAKLMKRKDYFNYENTNARNGSSPYSN